MLLILIIINLGERPLKFDSEIAFLSLCLQGNASSPMGRRELELLSHFCTRLPDGTTATHPVVKLSVLGSEIKLKRDLLVST